MNVQYGRAKWTPFDQLDTPRTPIPCERDALPDLADPGRAKLDQLTFERMLFISLHAEHVYCARATCVLYVPHVRPTKYTRHNDHTATIRVLLPYAHAHA
jgi:hypothetical protein